MDIEKEIITLTESIIDRDDIFLVDVLISGHNKAQKIQVFLDGDNGIGIDTCTKVSRKLSELLDEHDVISDKYILEVSSPGLDRPLILKRQYTKNIGKNIKITTVENKTIKGALISVGEDDIVVSTERKKSGGKSDKESITIPFGDIKKANILVIF